MMTTGQQLENPPAGEGARIDNVAALTVKQLDGRYSAAPRCLRGVHPKDHGCVEGLFTVSPTLPRELQVGIFSTPGAQFATAIRFSNASALVTPDSLEPGPDGKPVVAHGSRGMAVKLYGIPGDRLMPGDGERTQDFLMINQPVFAFANVEDYEALSQIIVATKDDPRPFFARMASPDPAISGRAKRTAQIVQRIKAVSAPPAFQPPPLSPFDNRYFSAAPFLFGEGRAMKFSAVPVNPMTGDVTAACQDPNYLRAALRTRMAEAQGNPICFDFQVQVRSADSLAGKIDTDIEDVCTIWDEAAFPFVTVARITIPSQDVAEPERQEFCETLVYTPWHGLKEHRPLGGINRLRQAVYTASSKRRGCPASPQIPMQDLQSLLSGGAPQPGRGGGRGGNDGGRGRDDGGRGREPPDRGQRG
jgi:hypothetical protein